RLQSCSSDLRRSLSRGVLSSSLLPVHQAATRGHHPDSIGVVDGWRVERAHVHQVYIARLPGHLEHLQAEVSKSVLKIDLRLQSFSQASLRVQADPPELMGFC